MKRETAIIDLPDGVHPTDEETHIREAVLKERERNIQIDAIEAIRKGSK